MYLIYSFLLTVGAILAAPYSFWRWRKGMRLDHWGERFGRLPEAFQQTGRGAIWVHAVSVGETLAVVGLVRELQQLYPERKIFLSHVTPAARAAGESRLPGIAGRFYLPLDWRWSVRGAFKRIRPSLLVIVETELWPNLFRVARESGGRVVLVNARLSERSFRGYWLARRFMGRVLDSVDRICAQSEADSERFRRLGAKSEDVVLAGNLKFDAQPPQLGELPRLMGEALAQSGRGPVLVAASTMPGEEPLVVQAWEKIQAQHPRALLILAPRHPQRFQEVAQILSTAGHSFLRRTSMEGQGEALARQLAAPEVLLLDSIGELAALLELASAVFIGGSLVPKGGHNLLEAAYWSKPIVFGPHMENFRDVAQLFLREGAAIQVQDGIELAQVGLRLFADDEARRQMGERARQVLARESGATGHVLGQIREMLEAEATLPAGT